MRLITVRGTGERGADPSTMLGLVARNARERVPMDWTDVEYPASIALANPHGDLAGASELESRAAGVEALRAAIDRHAGQPIVVAGYSLGALVVSDLLEHIERYEIVHGIRAVVLLANPARAAGDSYGAPSFGFGLDGAHGPWPGIPHYEIANPNDVITSAHPHSPWRRFAVAIRGMDLDNPGPWFAALTRSVEEFHSQGLAANWWRREWWEALALPRARIELDGYLWGGQHTVAYGKPLWVDETGGPISGITLAAQVIARYA